MFPVSSYWKKIHSLIHSFIYASQEVLWEPGGAPDDPPSTEPGDSVLVTNSMMLRGPVGLWATRTTLIVSEWDGVLY